MRKTEIHFFTIADYIEEEIWLREHHKAGWKLVKMTPPCFYTFESCEPEDVIYRLDYKNSGETEEYMQMMEDFGWEYFARCMGWLYYRKPARAMDSAEEGELFSDPESRTAMVSHIIKTRFVPLLIIFCCCLLPNLFNVFSGRTGAFSGFFGVLFSILTLVYIYLIVHCGSKLKQLKER